MLQTAFLLAVEAAVEAIEAAEAVPEAASGGLFDLNATLPLMALQTIVLVAILNQVFYKPFTQVLDERSDYVRDTRSSTQNRLDEAKKLAKDYEQNLAETRKQAQAVIAEAQAEAQRLAAQQMAQAQREAQQQREQAQREIEAQKQAALQVLEQQVDSLSNQILTKLLAA